MANSILRDLTSPPIGGCADSFPVGPDNFRILNLGGPSAWSGISVQPQDLVGITLRDSYGNPVFPVPDGSQYDGVVDGVTFQQLQNIAEREYGNVPVVKYYGDLPRALFKGRDGKPDDPLCIVSARGERSGIRVLNLEETRGLARDPGWRQTRDLSPPEPGSNINPDGSIAYGGAVINPQYIHSLTGKDEEYRPYVQVRTQIPEWSERPGQSVFDAVHNASKVIDEHQLPVQSPCQILTVGGMTNAFRGQDLLSQMLGYMRFEGGQPLENDRLPDFFRSMGRDLVYSGELKFDTKYLFPQDEDIVSLISLALSHPDKFKFLFGGDSDGINIHGWLVYQANGSEAQHMLGVLSPERVTMDPRYDTKHRLDAEACQGIRRLLSGQPLELLDQVELDRNVVMLDIYNSLVPEETKFFDNFSVVSVNDFVRRVAFIEKNGRLRPVSDFWMWLLGERM